MKHIIKVIAAIALLISTSSCSKDDKGTIIIQDHDESQMMALKHQMMDKMMTMEMTKDPDNDFAMMMRTHHLGAIDMANLELKNGKDEQLKAMAQTIIETQQAEITQLDAFLQTHSPHLNNPEFDQMIMTVMEKSSKESDLQVINGDTDHDFAILMIQHHQSAIENSRLVLLDGHEESMKQMAVKIIDEQEKEISELQDWLLARGHK
ncbi:DUF305 domain-containing protein [Albibacterium bauzanense]|uniref:Uncharacterized protein (DUF305 family) n=1 Tax=Albibacterium bauzanense TaxID=653929 RepID=A0A4V2PXA1_9SPHI|nr:DUF305 domain-containing protein [Albibacterium bauzanense]TCK80941.1 uncharacterized protein (DUF305 family) [Albibacterium bauzanense]